MQDESNASAGERSSFLHAKMCEHWGLERLKEKQYAYSADELEHASRVVAHILFLEGEPVLEDYRKVPISQTVEQQLKLDLDLVTHAAQVLHEAIIYCREQRDDVSKELFQDMLKDEEQHIYWLEVQLGLIQKLGLQNYLQSQM